MENGSLEIWKDLNIKVHEGDLITCCVEEFDSQGKMSAYFSYTPIKPNVSVLHCEIGKEVNCYMHYIAIHLLV